MPRVASLDRRAPLVSLRAAAGKDGRPLSGAGLAAVRGVARSTEHGAERAGKGISVGTLAEYVEATGGELELTARWPDEDTVEGEDART